MFDRIQDQNIKNKEVLYVSKLVLIFIFSYVSPVMSLTLDEGRHLLTRTGFGAAPHELEEYLSLDRKSAVHRLISSLRTKAVTPNPSIIQNQYYAEAPLDVEVVSGCSVPRPEFLNNSSLVARHYAEHHAMRRWWWTEIINTPSPLTEKLTLFWHDHFATKFDYAWAIPQFENNVLLRKHAGGNFKSLAYSILKDPAMLYFLNNDKNVRLNPNENLAREFLELFTMGEGKYSERDVKELGKVLAGHGISDEGCEYEFREDLAYEGEVTLFGKKGKFSLKDAVNIVFDQPQVAEYIVEKFWAEFISPDLNEEQIKPLARIFEKSDFNIKVLLEKILLSEEFWSIGNRGTLTKSPVELLAGTVRSFGIWLPDPDLLIFDSVVLDQDLFAPPSVEGWPLNDSWVNPRSVVLRAIALNRLVRFNSQLEKVGVDKWDLREGLLVQVSSEKKINSPKPKFSNNSFNPEFKVYVNEEEIDVFSLALSESEGKQKSLGFLPQPELLYVPKEKLPNKIESVKVEYTPDLSGLKAGTYPLFAVHWVSYQGIRYNAHAAKQSFYDEPENVGNIPVGMVYPVGALDFNFQELRDRYQKASSPNKSFMAYNVDTPIIAGLYTNGNEEVWDLQPAGKNTQKNNFDTWKMFQQLSVRANALDKKGNRNNDLNSAVMAILPIAAQFDGEEMDKQAIASILNSPLYQLK